MSILSPHAQTEPIGGIELFSISSSSPQQSRPDTTQGEDAYSERECAPLAGPPPANKAKRVLRFIVMVVLATSLVLGIWHHKWLEHWFKSDFLPGVEELGLWAAVVLMLVTAALNIVMLPTFPVMFGAGVVFFKMYEHAVIASLVGTVSVFVGLWLGSMCAFQLGRTLMKDFAGNKVNSTENQTFKIINLMINEEGMYIVLLARMSPLLPAEVFNYACALTNLTLFQYGLGCVGSIVPVTFWVVTAAVTTRAAEVKSSKSAGNASMIFAVNAVVLIALTSVLYRSFRKYKIRLHNESNPTVPA